MPPVVVAVFVHDVGQLVSLTVGIILIKYAMVNWTFIAITIYFGFDFQHRY